MKREKNNLIGGWPVYLTCLLLVAAVYWASRKYPSMHRNRSLGKAIAMNISGQSPPLDTMQDIIDVRRTWDPVLMDWYGRKPRDFAFTDITGKEHRLAEFLGKNLLVVFWATWSPASFMEISHLIRLRRHTPPDDLAIVAFSSETAEKLAEFVRQYDINYTVVSVNKPLPAPFAAPHIRQVPASIYIDRDGRIKLAVEGIVPFVQARAILAAEE